jgi:uncharacterized protein (UPF0332 family)
MSLSDWLKNDWLQPHQTSRQEIQNLLSIIRRDLKDGQLKNLSLDWQYAICYNAALQCCTIALYCKGYKPARGQSEHYRVIQSLPFTLGEKYREIRDYLNSCRAKRNISDYDTAGTISEQEVKELYEVVIELQAELDIWLAQNYSDYYQR